jgi:predicted Rossmann fold flavoprotein
LNYDLIIIGAGACGIITSIMAKNFGIQVALIEGGDRIGKKILTTGNGRCNITNSEINCLRYHSDNKLFFKHTLDSFNLDDTLNFFKSLGLYVVTLEEGKIYPMSLQASSVLDIFRFNLEDKGIPLYLNSKVKTIEKHNLFKVITEDGTTFTSKKVLLCTGGKSYSKTGSDGSGYNLAKSLGHNVISTTPGLVQLKLKYDRLKALSGVKFNGCASIFVDGKLKKVDSGEILFTDYGISGPPILQLSRVASKGILNKRTVKLTIDMMIDFSKEALIDFFESHFAIFSYRSISENLVGIINKKLIPIVLKEAGIEDIHSITYNISYDQRFKLYNLLKQWEFLVSGTNSFDNAQVTLGGIDTTEVYNTSLESKLVPGLYFGGEILDVDGDCGGFNLQWAWSSGAMAIKSIYEQLNTN